MINKLQQFASNAQSFCTRANLQGDQPSITFCNDGIVGFFLALPPEQMLQATQYLVDAFLDGGYTFIPTAATSTSDKKVFRGKVCQERLYPLQVELIPVIIRWFLSSSVFIYDNQTFRQVRGDPIGANSSPALCLSTVAFIERG